MKKRGDRDKLDLWQERYQRNLGAYAAERAKMDRREELYGGTKEIRGVEGGAAKRASHVRNLTAEMVESQVSSTIPQPKVTALRPQDEKKAKLVEDMLRNELDRLPTEYLNDQQERTTYIQGGAFALCEWDNGSRTHDTVGALKLSDVYPKKLIPQDGVTSDLEEMDYFFLDLPQTKGFIRRRYGVDVSDEAEDTPEVKGAGSCRTAEELVTQHVAFFRGETGSVGVFSWVGEHVLEDLEDYQARRVYLCRKCGQRGNGVRCSFCASERFQSSVEEYEALTEDIQTTDGRVIPAWSPVLDERGMPVMEPVTDAAGNPVMQPILDNMGQPMRDGLGELVLEPLLDTVQEPTRIPFYKPGIYPVVLRKNVSVYGKLLGDSDVDRVEDQQETTKKLSTKICEKIFKGGSVMTAPMDAVIDFSDEELRVLRLKGPEEKAMLGVYNLQPDISGDLQYRADVYEEARQTIGITDSFQGRKDATATSGVAKEFSARQSAGRLESKRTMKDAYWSRLFEVMFKFMLAYSDERRPFVSEDNQGHKKYQTWYRYDFLEQDETGEWYWNDQFLFSTDASATLEGNREAMWQECRMNFQQGAYGDPTALDTLVVFWTRMEKLHYPGASDTKTYFEEKLSRQQEEAAQLAAMQQGGAGGGGIPASGSRAAPVQGMEEASADTAEQIAQADARREAQAMFINGGGRI